MGQSAEIAYLLKNTKPLVSAALQEMVSNKELLQISAGGNRYYALHRTTPANFKPVLQAVINNLTVSKKSLT